MPSILDLAKHSATKLATKFQTERWFNGTSVDPVPPDNREIGIFLYAKYAPPMSVSIPKLLDTFPVILIDESKQKL